MKDYLFVFDLDFTLWNCGGTYCDNSLPPYKIDGGKILDTAGSEMNLYPDVIHILEELFHSGTKMAVASRTTQPLWAEDLMKLLGIDPYFQYREIYPGSKIRHFKSLREKTGFPFERMIFFDDDPLNIQEVTTLGVNCILVNNGLCYEKYKASCNRIMENEMVKGI